MGLIKAAILFGAGYVIGAGRLGQVLDVLFVSEQARVACEQRRQLPGGPGTPHYGGIVGYPGGVVRPLVFARRGRLPLAPRGGWRR